MTEEVYKVHTVDKFDKIVNKNYKKYIRFDINDNIICAEINCSKYATYKNTKINKCICWLHYYLLIENT